MMHLGDTDAMFGPIQVADSGLLMFLSALITSMQHGGIKMRITKHIRLFMMSL